MSGGPDVQTAPRGRSRGFIRSIFGVESILFQRVTATVFPAWAGSNNVIDLISSPRLAILEAEVAARNEPVPGLSHAIEPFLPCLTVAP